MRAAFDLLANMLRLPWPWRIWVAVLALANLAGGVVFFDRLQGKAAVAVILLGFLVMTAVHARFGFVRLLGLGHVLWLGLVPWFAMSVGSWPPSTPFDGWLLSIVAVNGISVVIDVVDVARWIRGERAPTL